jgi:hypothetical protein
MMQSQYVLESVSRQWQQERRDEAKQNHLQSWLKAQRRKAADR